MIDFGLAKFDEMYAADEGADTGADLVGEDSSSGSPWYLAPLACMSSTPEAVHKAAWRGKGARLAPGRPPTPSTSSGLSSMLGRPADSWPGRLVVTRRVQGAKFAQSGLAQPSGFGVQAVSLFLLQSRPHMKHREIQCDTRYQSSSVVITEPVQGHTTERPRPACKASSLPGFCAAPVGIKGYSPFHTTAA